MKVPCGGTTRASPPRAANATTGLDGERVVAAGIDHQDVDSRLPVAKAVEHGVERDRLGFQEFLIAGGGFGNVDREEIVCAGDLDAMPCEIEQRHVAGLDAI